MAQDTMANINYFMAAQKKSPYAFPLFKEYLIFFVFWKFIIWKSNDWIGFHTDRFGTFQLD